MAVAAPTFAAFREEEAFDVLCGVVQRNDVDTLKLLLPHNKRAPLDKILIEVFKTPASPAREEMIRQLLAHGAPVNPTTTAEKTTNPLRHALQRGDVAVVGLLLDHGGINANTILHQETTGLLSETNMPFVTCLHEAVAYGHDDVVRLLVHRGADIDACCERRFERTTFHQTVLRWAVERRRAMVALLLDLGANPAVGESCLSAARDEDSALRLIGHGAPVHMCNVREVIKGRSLGVLRILLQYGADPYVNHLSNAGYLVTTLTDAAASHQWDMADLLVDYGVRTGVDPAAAAVEPFGETRISQWAAAKQAVLQRLVEMDTDRENAGLYLQPTRGHVYYVAGARKVDVPWTDVLHPYTPRHMRATVHALVSLRLSPDERPAATWGALPWELVEAVVRVIYRAIITERLERARKAARSGEHSTEGPPDN